MELYQFLNYDNFFESPLNSSKLNIYTVNKYENENIIKPISFIKNLLPCIVLPYNSYYVFIPILHCCIKLILYLINVYMKYV